ncbi:MAG: tryptophan 2-monooxygenase [Myxococcota bacterium]|jgi:tryptophan 2-monooxygenase
MSFVANKRSITPPSYSAWPSMDTLYDYMSYITQTDAQGNTVAKTIGTLPDELLNTRVAIIGGGPAGMVAAWELHKLGLVPVIFEAGDRLGGRNWSKYFTNADGSVSNVIAEMGAMRFPPINKVLYYYARDLFKLTFEPSFPDPGKVPTRLYYRNTVYTWAEGEDPPGPFTQINTDWNAFFNKITLPLEEAYANGNLEEVQVVWQGLLVKYANETFFKAVVDGIPQWDTQDFEAFGALGVGSGGFGPLYGVDFVEMLRITAGQYETDQELLIEGISGLCERFYTTRVETPLGTRSLQEIGAARLATAVKGISLDDAGRPVVHTVDAITGADVSEAFPTAIVATSTRSMEFFGLTLPAAGETAANPILEPDERAALRDLHLMNSSKLFIRTKTKFWKTKTLADGSAMPQNIQTDELPRGVYCLDYPDTDNGVVLISYTWGDDSTKLLGVPTMERFHLFRQVIHEICPEFAAELDPVNGEVLNVDWEQEPYQYGAFKLNQPGQEPACQSVYFQFLAAKKGSRVFLAGDSVSWFGGWTEGALETGLNAAASVVHALGGQLPADSPLSQQAGRYDYSGKLRK